MEDIAPNSKNSLTEASQSSEIGFCDEALEMGEKCRKCGTEMKVIDRAQRELIEEVTEVHYRCPNCGYEIIIPELVKKVKK